MSALYGAIAWHGHSVDKGWFLEMQEALRPYGTPSVTGMGVPGRWSAALGVCDKDQPSRSRASDDSFEVCADSFLHDRGGLMANLDWRGPAESSDADLIMAAFRRWGDSFADHLNGSFSIAILDRRRGALLLVCDQVGSRFLAYHERDGLVAFASTALALTAFPGVGHQLDEERLAEVIALGYGTDRTFVRGVRSIPPGTAMWCEGSGVRRWRWWLPSGPIVDDLGSLSKHAEALRDELERSVRSTLRGAARPGVRLSGGLDSSSVAAVAAGQVGNRSIRTYTVVPPPGWKGPTLPGWIPDERFAVESLARRHPNLKAQFLHIRGFSLFEHHEKLWELGAGPIRNPLNSIWSHLIHQEAAADGVDVLLEGGNGNFGFSADGPRWLAELALRGKLIRVTREALSWAEARDKRLWRIFRGDLVWPLLPATSRQRRAVHQRVDLASSYIEATAIRSDRLREMNLEAVLPEPSRPHPRGWTRDPARAFQVPAAQAETAAAMQALYGIASRDPLADRVLLETALRQPEWWRRHDGVSRAVCRAAMRDVLPAEIVDRTTGGAQLPDWLDRLTDRRSEVAEELQQLRDHAPSRNVIDVEKLDRLMQAWPDLSQAADPKVIADYQSGFSRALLVSKYARWFESRGRRVAAGGPAVMVSPP